MTSEFAVTGHAAAGHAVRRAYAAPTQRLRSAIRKHHHSWAPCFDGFLQGKLSGVAGPVNASASASAPVTNVVVGVVIFSPSFTEEQAKRQDPSDRLKWQHRHGDAMRCQEPVERRSGWLQMLWITMCGRTIRAAAPHAQPASKSVVITCSTGELAAAGRPPAANKMCSVRADASWSTFACLS